jgi:hypothetical protein
MVHLRCAIVITCDKSMNVMQLMSGNGTVAEAARLQVAG